MSRRCRLSVLQLLLVMMLTVASGGASRAAGPDFDYQVERFSLTKVGLGGQPETTTDEFDDGVLAPWFPAGTVSESGGALHLMAPGIEDSSSYSLLNPDITLYRSDAFADDTFGVSGQAGNFSGLSAWRALPDLPGGFYTMGLRYFSPAGTEILSLSVSNFDAPTADAFERPVGLSISFAEFTFDQASQTLTFRDEESFALDASGLAGEIVLQIDYDDLTNAFSAGVSVDGGATFQQPFADRIVDLPPQSFGFEGANFFLFGSPAVVPEPSTGLLLGTGLLLLGARRRIERL